LRVRWPTAWTVLVGYEDNTDALRWQVQQLIEDLGGRFDIGGFLGGCAEPAWRALTEFPPPADWALSFKAAVRPAAVAAFLAEAERLLAPVLLEAHAGNGVVNGHCRADGAARTALAALRVSAIGDNGHLL